MSPIEQEGFKAFDPDRHWADVCHYRYNVNRADFARGWKRAQKARQQNAAVDQQLEAVMRRLAFALSSREAADAVKELVETLIERKS